MPSQQYFQNITTLPALEKERRRLAKLHHPDVAGGSLTVMQEINAEYERAKDRLSSPTAREHSLYLPLP
jgi:curved DNA-binding protein CbpA